MDYRRVIPCLDVKDGRLVKGVRFSDLKDVGDPAEAAARYSAGGADELLLLDIMATVEKRKTLLDIVRRTSDKTTVPLTVGGGVRSVADIENLLTVGATKVAINTAAVRDPNLVIEAAEEFGPECITVALNVRKFAKCKCGYEVVVGGGRKGTGQDALEWAVRAEDLGTGALLVASIDADGTQAGYDLKITRAIADTVSVPVMAAVPETSLWKPFRLGTASCTSSSATRAETMRAAGHRIRAGDHGLFRRGVGIVGAADGRAGTANVQIEDVGQAQRRSSGTWSS